MNTQMIPLVEQAVIERLYAKTSFTALDISNTLKVNRYPVTHGTVAEVVRDIYRSGAMAFYDFDRRLISVVTESGTKATKTFLYLHQEAREREYTAREQISLPQVPPDQARPLPGRSPLTMATPVLPNRRGRGRRDKRPRNRQRIRRDGALAVPRSVLLRLGWNTGETLMLQTQPGRLILQPATVGTQPAARIWSNQRLRICRRKLHSAHLTAYTVTFKVSGNTLTLGASQ